MKKGHLLDTNIILFWYFDSGRIKPIVKKLANSSIYVSLFSLWEITLKNQIGKLPLPMPLGDLLQDIRDNFHILSFEFSDIHAYAELPLIHRDPLDRMIASQAIARHLCLVTADRQFKEYRMDKIILA